MKNMKRNAARLLLFATLGAVIVFVALSVPREANLVAGVLALLVLGMVMSIASSREKFAMTDATDLEMDRIAAIMDPLEHPVNSGGVRLDLTDLGDQVSRHQAAARRAAARVDAAYKKRWHPGRWFADNFGLPSPESLAVADRDVREYGQGSGLAITRLTDSGPEVVR